MRKKKIKRDIRRRVKGLHIRGEMTDTHTCLQVNRQSDKVIDFAIDGCVDIPCWPAKKLA